MRKLIAVLIFVAGVGSVSLSIGAALWGLAAANLIDLDQLRAYPSYQL
jgi:hypothetical protein